ncbi:hypothetical protein BDC45DRAFT_537227 [Circinella umbellata]|nr:hypothetical protein BDC45DRAFT_537227 [Circinella umbellata]
MSKNNRVVTFDRHDNAFCTTVLFTSLGNTLFLHDTRVLSDLSYYSKSSLSVVRIRVFNEKTIKLLYVALVKSSISIYWRHEKRGAPFFGDRQKKLVTKPYIEEAAAEYDEKTKYKNFTLDIGWCMRKVNGPQKLKHNVHRYTKKCDGFIQCTDKNCRFFAKQLRPPLDLEQIKKHCTVIGCMNCGGYLEHVNTCTVAAHYCFRGTKCTVEQIGTHSHAQYISKHLSEEEKDILAERLRADPTVTPKAAIQGNNRRTGEVVDSVIAINPILATRDITEYELNKFREKMDIPRRGELLGEFGKILKTYPDYFLHAQVVPNSFLVIYQSPIINRYCRFQNFPAVTDVTHKAVEKGYYVCTTVIYVPGLKRHTVIFQALLGAQKEEYFAQYFFAFFVDHKVRFDGTNPFLGMMLDFSMAQSDVRNLVDYEEHAVPSAYNRVPQPKKKKTSSKKEVNDGSPPDVTKELVEQNIQLDLSYFDEEILTASSHDSIDIADERTVHMLDMKVEPFDIEVLEHMTKEIEIGTEEIMQRIMCTDVKEVDQKECKEEENNDEVSENTFVMMTKKNGRKNKKRKQHYNAEDL